MTGNTPKFEEYAWMNGYRLKDLEFEQRAFVRRLIREGRALLSYEDGWPTITRVIIIQKLADVKVGDVIRLPSGRTATIVAADETTGTVSTESGPTSLPCNMVWDKERRRYLDVYLIETVRNLIART